MPRWSQWKFSSYPTSNLVGHFTGPSNPQDHSQSAAQLALEEWGARCESTRSHNQLLKVNMTLSFIGANKRSIPHSFEKRGASSRREHFSWPGFFTILHKEPENMSRKNKKYTFLSTLHITDFILGCKVKHGESLQPPPQTAPHTESDYCHFFNSALVIHLQRSVNGKTTNPIFRCIK